MTLIRMLAFRPQHSTPALSSLTPRSAQSPTVDWAAMVAALDLDGPTRMLALHCTLAVRAPGHIRLQLDPRNASARTSGREEKLGQALSAYLGEKLRLEIEVGTATAETPAQAGERASAATLAAAQQALSGDSTAVALQEQFGATINVESVRPRK